MERGRQQFLESLDGQPLQIPFWMTDTHLMFTKGSINDRQGLNMFMDSGIAVLDQAGNQTRGTKR